MGNTILPKLTVPPAATKVAAEVGKVAQQVAKAVQGQDVGSTFDAVSSAADWTETAVDAASHSKVEQVAAKLSQGLASKTTSVAQKLDKVMPHIQNAGVAAAALSATANSDASTTAGKVFNGAAVATLSKVAAVAVSTPVAVVDMALNAAGEKLVGKKLNQAAGGYITGHAISTPAAVATAYLEAATGDTRALDKFADKARGGEYGAIYQAAVKSGDYWAEHGIVGGLKEAKAAYTSGGGAASLVGFAKDRWQAARDFFTSP